MEMAFTAGTVRYRSITVAAQLVSEARAGVFRATALRSSVYSLERLCHGIRFHYCGYTLPRSS
jgi:hypothetical protein